jgi:hypothetical protein
MTNKHLPAGVPCFHPSHDAHFDHSVDDHDDHRSGDVGRWEGAVYVGVVDGLPLLPRPPGDVQLGCRRARHAPATIHKNEIYVISPQQRTCSGSEPHCSKISFTASSSLLF